MNGLDNLISYIMIKLLIYIDKDERIRIKERQKQGIKGVRYKEFKFGRKNKPCKSCI